MFVILKLKKYCTLTFFIIFISSLYSQPPTETSVFTLSKQIIIVVTDSTNTDQGFLYRFERNEKLSWNLISKSVPVIIGRKGFALGNGLISLDDTGMDNKVEGDKKSPAGVFTLTKAFGFIHEKELNGLKISYIQITDMTECIDDPRSKFYNQIIRSNKVNTIDWNSSEKMWKADPWYRFGVFVDNNSSPVNSGNGSCIFLHNWDGPDDSTVGCTAMAPEYMRDIVLWLDSEKDPLLVQLPVILYDKYKDEWKLPNLELTSINTK